MQAQKTTAFIKQNQTVIFISIVAVLLLAMLYYLLFVNKQTAQFFGQKPAPTPAETFKSLDKGLNQVVTNENPVKAAEEENLAVKDDTVVMVITLKDDSFVFTPEYGTEQIRYGRYIQAFVKLSKLEELAKNPKIESIVAPKKATQQPPSGAPIIISPNPNLQQESSSNPNPSQ